MDNNLNKLNLIKAKRCQKNLVLNKFKCDIVEDEKQCLNIINSLLFKDAMVSHGGSMTLNQIGIIQRLKDDSNLVFIDPFAGDVEVSRRKVFNSDIFFTSSNAVTLDGELYNIDGTGNRVSAMIYGPNKVIVVVGINKLVENIIDAQSRCQNIACVANNIRLNNPNPCTVVGKCINCKKDTRICSSYVTIKTSYVKDRIHVIIVNKELGF